MRLRDYLIILPMAAVIGCGRDEPTAPPASPAPAVSASQPSTAPAATRPVKVEPAKLTIDGREFTFTPAVLVFRGEAPRLTGTLYSGGEPGESGNALYFDLAFDLDEGSPIAEATCRYRTNSHDRADSPAGILVPAEKVKLQAMELSVDLDEPVGGAVVVKMDGQFLVFPDDADVATRIVKVSGKFRCAMGGK